MDTERIERTLMLDDLEGKRTGERIQTIRERKGMSRAVLAGLVGYSAEWLKGIESGRRLPPRLPVLIRLAEVLAVGDVAILAGSDMDLGGNITIPISAFARIPHEAVPAIREAVRAPLLTITEQPQQVAALRQRTADAWQVWHTSRSHRTDVGRVLPSLIRDVRASARQAQGEERRNVHAVLADLWALVQHVIVWASEPELIWVVADRAMAAAQEADQPAALAGAAWTYAIVQRSGGDTDAALTLALDAAGLLRDRLDDGGDELRALYGAMQLHAATTAARAGREGDAWRFWDEAAAVARRLPTGYHHPWTQFGSSNVALHAVSIGADLTKSASAKDRAEQIDPDSIPSRERRARLHVEIARTYHQRRDWSSMLDWLQQAYAISHDSVHFSPTGRLMASDAVDQGGPLIERRARGFAQELGLPL
ncbi:helix-turn-helix transcriptional regulator [Nonomuraea sp. NPDC026600]|uniref:helix-turn-helix domain-containing protein n=1 Tax=Nonomuraea sp. NPDC026600 TaxID=3155363 RepID=UPI0033EE27FE